MLDRAVVEVLLEEEFDDLDLERPEDISKTALVETFCQYAENDYYEWLKDNMKSFLNYGDPDWRWIKNKINSFDKQ